MKKRLIEIALWGSLGGVSLLVPAAAQEHKHEEAKPQKEAAPNKSAPAPKESPMPCCEMMQKMGEVKEGMPMKHEMTGEMKAKMEKMKAEMKQKMAEKKTGPDSGAAPEKKSAVPEAGKSGHQH